jgi:pimeloyl-ACP methyl ester carboxylesterase
MTLHLEHAGGQLAYDDSGGDGPLVVATPGMGDVRRLYRFAVPALAGAGYRVVTLDIRGHGETSARWDDYGARAIAGDVLALVRHLDAGPAVVIGESMTCASAVQAAADAPELVRGLVLLGPAVRFHDPGPFGRLALAAVGRSAGLWTWYYRSLYPANPPEDLGEYVRALRANLREPGRLAALRGILRSVQTPVEWPFAAVRAPSLLVMGTKDPDFPDPAEELRWVASQLPGARTLTVEGAGHYPLTEFPDVVTPELLAFLSQIAHAR